MTEDLEAEDDDLRMIADREPMVIEMLKVWRRGGAEIIASEKAMKRDGLKIVLQVPRADIDLVRDLDPDEDELIITIERRMRPPEPPKSVR